MYLVRARLFPSLLTVLELETYHATSFLCDIDIILLLLKFLNSCFYFLMMLFCLIGGGFFLFIIILDTGGFVYLFICLFVYWF